MAAKLSLEVTSRLRSCLFVISALWHQGPKVAAKALGIVQPHLQEGDESPGFLSTIIAFARTLKAAVDWLVALDRKLFDANERLADLRRVRDAGFETLAQQIIGLRRSVKGQYIAPELEGLGLQAPNARDPIALVRQANLIGDKLDSEDLDRKLGPPRFEEGFDPRPQARQVKTASSDLRSTIEQINTEQRKVDEILVEKDDAMSDYDNVFLRVARQFEDTCRFTGDDKLAAKVRPSTRRSSADGPPAPLSIGRRCSCFTATQN